MLKLAMPYEEHGGGPEGIGIERRGIGLSARQETEDETKVVFASPLPDLAHSGLAVAFPRTPAGRTVLGALPKDDATLPGNLVDVAGMAHAAFSCFTTTSTVLNR
jgi:hypothetical protein